MPESDTQPNPCDPEPTNQSEKSSTEQSSNDAGKQGSSSRQTRVGQPTTEILNADGIAVSWDVLEESARAIGIPKTAAQYKVNAQAIRSRSKRDKWRKIPDGRELSKRSKANGSELATMTGDLSGVIDRHRATVFQKTSASIAKFRARAPKNFRELDAADKIARRSLGIDEDKPAQQSVLIQINEAIGEHEAPVPIEAHEIPCNPAPVHSLGSDTGQQHSLGNDEGQQGSSAPPAPPAASVSTETSRSLTLNPGDSSRRQFVIP